MNPHELTYRQVYEAVYETTLRDGYRTARMWLWLATGARRHGQAVCDAILMSLRDRGVR